jgi:drug/metabolite transporter (DMT)-like permease
MNARASAAGTSYGRAAFYMIVSAASFALSGFFAEHASTGSDARLKLFARFAIPFALTLPWMGFGGRLRTLHTRNLGAHVARAVCLVVSQYLFFVATQHTSLFQAMILYNTGPLFIALFSATFLRKRLSLMTIVGTVLGFAGAVLTLYRGLAAADPYCLVGVASGVFLALSQMALHRCAQNEPSSHTMLWTYALSTVVSALPLAVPLAAPFGATASHVSATQPTCLTAAACVAAVLMALGSLGNQFFRSQAYKQVTDASTVAPLLYLTIVFSLALDVAFNGKAPTLSAVLGATLIAGGAALPAFARGAAWLSRAGVRRSVAVVGS